jgi:hypothetical protein
MDSMAFQTILFLLGLLQVIIIGIGAWALLAILKIRDSMATLNATVTLVVANRIEDLATRVRRLEDAQERAEKQTRANP